MRLEALGFDTVFDYAGGKKDWVSEGMPVEGDRSSETRAGGLARTDPPTCRPDTPIGEVAGRDDIPIWGLCVVTDDEGIVHGLLDAQVVDSTPADTRAEEVMELAPWTRRPDASLPETAERLADREQGSVLVTTSRGRLLGVLFLDDIEGHPGQSRS